MSTRLSTPSQCFVFIIQSNSLSFYQFQTFPVQRPFKLQVNHKSITIHDQLKRHSQSQIWSHTFLQTYGTNLPTSLTYFLLFHQRLLTSETCCGHRYGLASLSTPSVWTASQTNNEIHCQSTTQSTPVLLLPLFTSPSPTFFHQSYAVSPQLLTAILHHQPLLQSIHFLGFPSTSAIKCNAYTIHQSHSLCGLLTKDNFYGNADSRRGIPSCCHPSPGDA